MQRAELLGKLETVAPALSDSDLIPVLKHVWFTGKELVAYNDHIGISVPLESDFRGAVPGQVLLGLLRTSGAKEAEFQPDGDIVVVKAGRALLKLASLPVEDFDGIFTMPKPSKNLLPIADTKRALRAIEDGLRSIGSDTGVPEQLGITLIPGKDCFHCYSTNNDTLSRSVLPLEGSPDIDRIILPATFCAQMLRLSSGEDKIALEVTNEYALLSVGVTRLFGRLIDAPTPIPFEKTLARHYTAEAKQALVPIPDMLQVALERAMIVTDSASDQKSTNLSVKKNKEGKKELILVSESDRGKVTDRMEIDDAHPEVSVRVEPKRIKAGCESFSKIAITSYSVVMTRGSSLYLVTALRD